MRVSFWHDIGGVFDVCQRCGRVAVHNGAVHRHTLKHIRTTLKRSWGLVLSFVCGRPSWRVMSRLQSLALNFPQKFPKVGAIFSAITQPNAGHAQTRSAHLNSQLRHPFNSRFLFTLYLIEMRILINWETRSKGPRASIRILTTSLSHSPAHSCTFPAVSRPIGSALHKN
jgi:hypothetical protein